MEQQRAHVACTFVMSTGIVSVDLQRAGLTRVALAPLALGLLIWAVLAARGELARQLAAVPATGVLATQLLGEGWEAASSAFAVAAALLLLAHRATLTARPQRVCGGDLLRVVALQSVGIGVAPWCPPLTVALLAAGLIAYALLAVRAAPSELVRGQGDQWIFGGAVAISSVAAASAGLHAVAVLLALLALAVLPALVGGEAASPRWGRIGARWSTVFPLGMYGAMSYQIGARAPAHVATAAAAAAWLLVLGATARRHFKTTARRRP